MTIDDTRFDSIFCEAIEVASAVERAAFINGACGSDEELRRRVERLVDAHFKAGRFLETPPESVTFSEGSAGPDEGAGTTIGPYKLLESIGEGGMGTVYMAEQTQPVRRKVALKIIKAGMDSKQVIARFEAERQALALMDHPNIAKVLDAGTTLAGRPYFVMELVKGIPITDYCDAAHLSPRERLELFVPVCQAIQHAHQKGVIHRDVKPTNVLVTLFDDKPVPKVIDFGVAKATAQRLTERTLFTGFGAVVGTLEYMSPEQAAMAGQDVDTRSDVYSLGVLLYELLTGTTPLERAKLRAAGYAEILRRIKEEEPPKPSTRLVESKETLASVAAQRRTEPARLTRLVRGELDWIVMRALEKDRTCRYDSASAFARDVQRFLDDETVEACPPSASYRLRKFARKNRALLATASAFAALLALGAAVSTWQAIRATRAEARANRERASATANYEVARGAVDSYLNTITEDADLNRTDFYQLRRKLLETALPFYESLIRRAPGEGRQEADHARAYHRLGLVYFRTGATEAALSNYRQAQAILERLAATPDGSTHREALVVAQESSGLALKELGRLAEAEAEYRQALARSEEFAAAAPKGDPHWQAVTARARWAIASVLDREGKTAPAEAAYRRAYEASRILAAQVPTELTYQDDCARHGEELSSLLSKTDRMAEALVVMRQVIASRETILSGAPDDPERQRNLARSYTVLAQVLDGLNRYDEADEALRKALERFEDLCRRFPSVPNHRAQAVAIGMNRGRLLTLLLRFSEAETAYRAAIELADRLARDFPKQPELTALILGAHHGFATLLQAQDKHREAEDEFRLILPIKRRLAAEFPDAPDLGSSLSESLCNLGNVLNEQNEKVEAERAYREAIEIHRRLVARVPQRPSLRKDLAYRLVNLAVCLADHPSRRDEAIALCREAIALEEKLAADFPESPDFGAVLALGHNSFGSLLFRMGRRTEAELEFRRSIDVSAKLVASFPGMPAFAIRLAGTYGNLGHQMREDGRTEDAIVELGKGIDLLSNVLKKFPSEVVGRRYLSNDFCWRAYALDDLGRHAEAVKDWHSALELSDPATAPKFRLGEAVSLARGDGRHDRALTLAANAATEPGIGAGALYSMACICAIASKDAPHREAYAAQAVDLLRLAVTRGFADEKLIRGDADFRRLLERTDFKAVVEEAGRRSAVAKPAAAKVE